MNRFIALGLALAAVACGGKDDTNETGAHHHTGMTDTMDTNTGTNPTDDVSPYVVTGTIECTNTGGTSNVDTWLAVVVADDPQGTEDLASFGSRLAALTVSGDAEAYNDLALVCASDGNCNGSVSADTSGIPCASAAQFYWQVQLLDNEGNMSMWTDLTPL